MPTQPANANADTSIIDLRSDTVTLPCQGMREAMAHAALGDDVYGEDPTVIQLEEKLAALTGHQAALFFPSGTQSNLVALLSHCQRGDEYIVAQNAHTYMYEAGGAAVLGGIQPQPLESEADGTLDLAKVARAIKVDDFHFARSKLLALENTTHGKVLPLDYIARAETLARENGLAMHLDGARLFNAAVHLDITAKQITRHFDSVSVCLSKGLGAPVGSLLCANREIIARAKRWRKMVGGGMRQIGGLAAAGIYALDNNIQRLREDHQHAQQLADGLANIAQCEIIGGKAQTNMVFARMDIPETRFAKLQAHAKKHRVLLGARLGPPILRLVTHKHIRAQDITHALEVIAAFFAK